MKWFQLANAVAPLLATLLPDAAPILAWFLRAVNDAQHTFGDDAAEQKRAHVIGAVVGEAERSSAIAPTAAATFARAWFQSIDSLHTIAKAVGAPSAEPDADHPAGYMEPIEGRGYMEPAAAPPRELVPAAPIERFAAEQRRGYFPR